jgi:hypothetical protein
MTQLTGLLFLLLCSWQVPTTWFLRYFDMELCLEDHDRHHAVGYRTSGDYGKQSRSK